MSEPLHVQLLRAVVKSDCAEAMRLLDIGADPFRQIELAGLSADVRKHVKQTLTRRMPPNMESNDG